ncbi:hypothetical protein, partial [Gluconacetobacter tumulicola]|uniref:hypothetical protein n=1 Tax=Gluconacetobacter tumulicola TaxID=1017177 RepID=UPI001C7EA2A8
MRQEILIGVERRRRWSDEQKMRVLSEVGVDGATGDCQEFRVRGVVHVVDQTVARAKRSPKRMANWAFAM